MVSEMNPEEQGLKQNTAHWSGPASFVSEMNPEEQGLKQQGAELERIKQRLSQR